ncbi:MAG: hypothetical protein ACOCXA_01720 [Planctomycetota bacterium]
MNIWLRTILVLGMTAMAAWLVMPMMDWLVREDRHPAKVMVFFTEPVLGDEDLRRLELVYQYRVPRLESVEIRLGRQVRTRSGQILAETMPAERALALEQMVAELGGPSALACVVAETAQGPVAYCPQLLGEQFRWPVGLSLIALAALLLILPELRKAADRRS